MKLLMILLSAILLALMLLATTTSAQGTPEQATVSAIQVYVNSLQTCLNIMIKKASLPNQLPFIGPPVKNALQQFQLMHAQLLLRIINTPCLTQEQLRQLGSVTQLVKALQVTANSINVLSGPLYPAGRGPFPDIIKQMDVISLYDSGLLEDVSTPALNCTGDVTDAANTLITLKYQSDTTIAQAISAYTSPI